MKGKSPRFSDWGGGVKGYSQTFLLHFQLQFYSDFQKWGASTPPYSPLAPPMYHTILDKKVDFDIARDHGWL